MTRYLNRPRGVTFDIECKFDFSNEITAAMDGIREQVVAAMGIPESILKATPVDTGFRREEWSHECDFGPYENRKCECGKSAFTYGAANPAPRGFVQNAITRALAMEAEATEDGGYKLPIDKYTEERPPKKPTDEEDKKK